MSFSTEEGTEIKRGKQWQPIAMVKEMIDRYYTHDVARDGAALTYYLLFAIFPLLVFISTLVGLMELDIEEMMASVSRILPEQVVGIVRSIEEYGTFVEIAPNLAGLADSCSGLAPGQAVSVYIKNILPEKMKIKLVIVNHALSQPHRFELRYFITEGHLDRWVYSTPECPKRIETDFAVAACNPG